MITLFAEKPAYFRPVALFFCWLALSATAGCSGGGSSGEGGGQGVLPADGSYEFSAALADVGADVKETIVVPVTVNGVQARFILDTGADTFIISGNLASDLGLPQIGSAAVGTIAGQSEVPVVQIDRIVCGNVTVSRPAALVQDTGNFDGAIGVAFLRHVTAVVEYHSFDQDGNLTTAPGTVQFADPAAVTIQSLSEGGSFEPGSGGRTILTSTPQFDSVEVEGAALGAGRIDTGNSGGVTVTGGLVSEIAAAKEQSLPVTLAAANGSVAGTAFIAGGVILDGEELSDQYMVSAETKAAQSSGTDQVLVGSLVLRQYSWVFDLPRSQVWLRRDRPQIFRLDTAAETE